MKAKKSFGQHFLNNEIIAEKIAQSLRHKDTDSNVLEVGPGKGVLTRHLLELEANLLAVEADRDMISYLQEHFPEMKGKTIAADFLKLDLNTVFGGAPFSLIGNYPYNISSQILFKMLEHKTLIPEMVGMFQKEVAQRIASPPGNKSYGVLSVLTQAFYQGEYLFSVPPDNFSPPPKVQSGVIRLTRHAVALEECNEETLTKVVKTAFGQRRKMLRNTLKTLVPDPEVLKDSFFNQRPEQLSVRDFIELSGQIEKGLVS